VLLDTAPLPPVGLAFTLKLTDPAPLAFSFTSPGFATTRTAPDEWLFRTKHTYCFFFQNFSENPLPAILLSIGSCSGGFSSSFSDVL
jgi:hypothetical protein